MSGVEVLGRQIVFGDNDSVVKGESTPHHIFLKKHLGIWYHAVCEALEADISEYCQLFDQYPVVYNEGKRKLINGFIIGKGTSVVGIPFIIYIMYEAGGRSFR